MNHRVACCDRTGWSTGPGLVAYTSELLLKGFKPLSIAIQLLGYTNAIK